MLSSFTHTDIPAHAHPNWLMPASSSRMAGCVRGNSHLSFSFVSVCVDIWSWTEQVRRMARWGARASVPQRISMSNVGCSKILCSFGNFLTSLMNWGKRERESKGERDARTHVRARARTCMCDSFCCQGSVCGLKFVVARFFLHHMQIVHRMHNQPPANHVTVRCRDALRPDLRCVPSSWNERAQKEASALDEFAETLASLASASPSERNAGHNERSVERSGLGGEGGHGHDKLRQGGDSLAALPRFDLNSVLVSLGAMGDRGEEGPGTAGVIQGADVGREPKAQNGRAREMIIELMEYSDEELMRKYCAPFIERACACAPCLSVSLVFSMVCVPMCKPRSRDH